MDLKQLLIWFSLIPFLSATDLNKLIQMEEEIDFEELNSVENMFDEFNVIETKSDLLNIDSEDVKLCSWGSCLCNSDESNVDCSSIGLTEVPDLHLFPVKVKFLNFSNNDITILPPSWEPLYNLKILDLSRNVLSSLISDAFANLTYLEELNLSHNDFHSWRALSPNSVLQPCENLKVLDLSHNQFNNLANLTLDELLVSESLLTLKMENCGISYITGRSPVSGLQSLQYFVLKANPLRKIKNLVSPTLKSLDLSNCQLNYVHYDTLDGLPSLLNLIMSHNYRLLISTNIGTLSSESLRYIDISYCNVDHPGLSGFPYLRRAVLSGNMIKLSISNEFLNNTKLEALDLSSNSISSINKSAFRGLVSLKFLNLSLNTISKIPEDTFLEIPSLSRLIVSRNYLKKFGSISSTTITKIDVSNCEIEYIENNSLDGLPSLIELNLSKNLISFLPDNLISTTLRYLDLSFNRLSSINNNTFSSLPRLSWLNLGSNRFSTIFKRDYFEHNVYLDKIELEDNTWRCECGDTYMFKFYEYLLLDPNIKEDPHDLICHSPTDVNGQTWQDACIYSWFTGTEYANNDKMVAVTLILMGSFIFFFIFIILVRRLVNAREAALHRERDRQAEEAIERLRLLRMRQEQEAQINAPDPRDLISPPSYAEALLMPRLDGSFHSLSEIVDGKKKKKRKTKRKIKSSGDILDAVERNVSIADSSTDESPEEQPKRKRRPRSRRFGSNEIHELDGSPGARRKRTPEVLDHTVEIHNHTVPKQIYGVQRQSSFYESDV